MALRKKQLTEEEAWLYLILTDPRLSAEFFWTDRDGNPFRLWDFQWKTFDLDNSKKEIFICARKTSKSTTIVARAFTFPFREPGKVMFITAAEMKHLERITTELNSRIYGSYIHRNFFVSSREVPKFRKVAANGTVIFGRVPQKSGVGVKSIHADEVYADEYQDFTPKAKVELNEVFQREGRRFLSGVPEIGADFHVQRLIDSSSSYLVWRIPRTWTPDWTSEFKKEKIEEYGSEEDLDYRRNIYGETIEEIKSVFPKAKLYQLVNKNIMQYYEKYNFRVEMDPASEIFFKDDISKVFDSLHLGIDIGWVASPTCALVIGQKGDTYYILKIFNFYRYEHPELLNIIRKLVKTYKPTIFAVDATGGGVSLYQEIKLIREDASGIDFRRKVEIDGQSIYLNDLSVEVLKSLVDAKKLIFPDDYELIRDWADFTMERSGDSVRYIKGENSHSIDAARVFAASLVASGDHGTFTKKSPEVYIQALK